MSGRNGFILRNGLLTYGCIIRPKEPAWQEK
jgi:hypothetical protein